MQLSTTQRSDDRQAELTAAFNAFGSVSEQLADAFDSLRLQVAELRGELREARAGNEHLAGRLSALLQALPAGVLVQAVPGVTVRVAVGVQFRSTANCAGLPR